MVQIPEELMRAIREHGRDSYGDEACGVMFGKNQASSKEVMSLLPLENSREGERHRRFLITPRDYQRAEAEASARGLELLGFYHSHPDHPAYPSTYDLEHAWPFFSYVIVSVRRGEPNGVRSFVMEEDRSGFSEEELRVI
jgi:proteasome lid subunit RPN8/RPN11